MRKRKVNLKKLIIKILLLISVATIIIGLLTTILPIKSTPSAPTPTIKILASPTSIPSLSTELIFNNSLIVNPSNLAVGSNQYLLLVTGDIIPARTVNYIMVTNNNFKLPFEKTANILKQGDIVFSNFESPLIKSCPLTNEGMIFCGSERAVEGLTFAGINVVSIANNHMSNYGEEGLDNTLSLLTKNNILVTGDGKIAYKQVKDKTFAFLGYNTIGSADNLDNKIREDIKLAKIKADFVVVMFHWGEEYTDKPAQLQKTLAHLAVEAGADLVVGNHPHQIQSIEFYKDKLIAYSHGNFVFDQMWSMATRQGVIGAYVFDDTGLINALYIPIIIDNFTTPRLADTKEKEEIIKKMKEASINLN